jgi:translocation and assembly module TamB
MARPRTIVFTAAGLLLGVLLLAIGAVGVLTQTDRGRATLLRAVLPVARTAIPGSLYLGRVGGSLFNDMTIDSLEIRAPDGTAFLRTGPVRLEYDPRDLLDRRIVLRFAQVTRPVVHLVDYGNNDWNWKRALRKAPTVPRPPSLTSGLGDWIRVDSLEVVEATLTVVEAWRPADSLRGARRDSAIAFNLARRDLEIDRDGDRLVKTRRWERGYAALGPSRISHPDTAGMQLAVRRLDAIENDPPFWFRNMSGAVRLVKDSLWVDDFKLHLPRSGGTASGKVVWGGGLPMRWDLRIRGDSVAFSDIAWISPVLPHVGGGTTELHIRNNPRNVRVIEYVITNMDARALSSRLRGRMTFAVGDTVLRISDVDLDLAPMHTDMLRWMNAEPFPYDWRGAITGRVQAKGGPVTRFTVDEARVAYADEHVPGAVTKGTIRGLMNVYEPAFAVFLGTNVEIEQLDLRTPRFVNPMFVEMNGLIAGTMTLDSLWTDVRFSNAQLAHTDGPGDTTRVTGDGRITLYETSTGFDVTMTAAPLSYTTMSRSYPSLPLRGLAVGPIRASGTVEDFSLTTALAGAGGEIAFTGTMDAFEPDFRVTGALRVAGADLRTLFNDFSLPETNVGFSADLNVSGESLATLAGTARAALSERSSRVGSVPLYRGIADLRFADGRMLVDSLVVESAAFRGDARGAIGLTAAIRDTLVLRATADSLGGLRDLARWAGFLADIDSVPADSIADIPVRGTLELRAQVVASLDTLEPLGVGVDLLADARDVLVGTTSARRAVVNATVDDVLRKARGSARLTLDSSSIAGVAADAVVANVRLDDGLPSRFDASLRAPSEATVAVSGGTRRVADSVAVRVDQLDVRTPSAARVIALRNQSARSLVDTSRNGFSLAWPAHIMIGTGGAVRLDSLLWQHSVRGTLAMRGAISADSALAGTVDAVELPLSDLGSLLRPSSNWGGSLSSAVRVAGSRRSPDMRGTVALRDASLGSVTLGQLDATAQYAAQRVNADVSLQVDGRTAFSATASLPMDLALETRSRRLLDEPLTGRITSNAVDLSVFESIVPSLQRGTGQLNTDISLTGTWEQPRLTGQLTVDRGALTVEPLGIRLESLSTDVRLAGDTISIRRLTARSGESRLDTMSLTGSVTIASVRDPVFDLRLTANSFTAIDRARVATLAISTVRPITLRGPRNNALLQGAARVDRGRLFLNSLSQRRALDVSDNLDLIDTTAVRVDAMLANAPNALVQGLSLNDVRLDIGEDVWLRSPEANIKLGGGLRLTRAVDPRDGLARLALADSLTVQRGTYQLNLGLARPTFDVERGTIRFFGDPDLDPALDIAALHVIRQQRPNSNRQDVRIRVRMGGTLTQPTLTLSSADNPPLPESDMLSYLVTGEPAYALFGTPYAEQGATLALRLASSYLSSRLAGGRFDLVQVEPTALNPGEATNLRQSGLGILAATRVGVGGQVGQRTFLSVTTGLCGLAPQGAGSADQLSLFAQGLGIKLERQFDSRFSAALGVEPGSSAQTCGRPGASRTFQQTPPQIGFDLFRSWSW